MTILQKMESKLVVIRGLRWAEVQGEWAGVGCGHKKATWEIILIKYSLYWLHWYKYGGCNTALQSYEMFPLEGTR